jgi:hypothetical protein
MRFRPGHTGIANAAFLAGTMFLCFSTREAALVFTIFVLRVAHLMLNHRGRISIVPRNTITDIVASLLNDKTARVGR